MPVTGRPRETRWPNDSLWSVQIVGTTIPSVLAACKEAYNAVVNIGMYKPLLQMKDGNQAYYINPDIDSIYIGSNLHF